MERTTNAPRSLILSTRLYQALLAVYPAEFRRTYGGPMLQVFGDCCRQVLHEAGPAGLLSLWWRTTLDTIQTAIEEHSQRGVDMSRSKFIKISSWALILGGIAFILGALAASRPEYDPYNFLSQPIDQYANAAVVPLFVMFPLLLSVGFIGLYLRYGQRAGSFGRYSLGLGALSGVISGLGSIGLSIFFGSGWSGLWWITFLYGVAFQFLGLSLFGLANLKQRTLPRWNGLPVFAGMWVTILLFTIIVSELATGRDMEISESVRTVVILLTMAGLAGLGYVLQSDSQASNTAADAA